MAQYTKLVKLPDKAKDRLCSYIEEELNRHYVERSDRVAQIQDWQFDYDATPSSTEAIFPFKGAATIIIPIAAITVEAIHARVMTTMFALDQFVSAKPQSSKWQNHARPVEKFLDSELLERIGIRKPINDALLETIKFGTGIAKTGYERIVKTAVRVNEKEEEEEFTYVVRANATVEAVAEGRFLMPFQYQDPQLAAWCGEEHEYTPYEVRQLEMSEFFAEGTMDKLNAHFTNGNDGASNGGDKIKEASEQAEKTEPMWPETITVQELWLGFDVEGVEDLVKEGVMQAEQFVNGFDKEIVIFYHRPSRQILSCRYNWHEDLRRPYRTGVYFPVEHRWRGIGVCKQVEQFQKEITTQHRQRIDNATIANCRMIKVNKLSDYGPNEPIFPGKMWFVDNMEDVQTFQLGEIYSSSYSNESSSLNFVQQRTGVNEVNLGMPQVGTPGTATSDLARIQEGNKKFDFTYSNHKAFVNGIIDDTILNIKQFGSRASVYYEMVDGGNLVKEFFAEDYEVLKNNFALKIGLASQQDNKLLDRQNMTQVVQFLQQYHTGMLELAQMSGDPAMIQDIARNGMYSATEAMRQILESFDLKNIDRLIYQKAIADVSQQSTGGNVGGTPVANTQPGMVPPPAPIA